MVIGGCAGAAVQTDDEFLAQMVWDNLKPIWLAYY